MNSLNIIYNSLLPYIATLEVKQRELIQKEINSLISKSNDSKYKEYQRNSFASKATTLLDNIEKDIHYWKLQIKYKLFKSLSNYIQQNDIISNITLSNSNKDIEISCLVNQIPFNTTCISAGGYNIQCYHFRYIVTTILSKNKNSIKFNKLLELEQLEYDYNVYLTKKPTEAGKYDTLEQRLNTFNNNCQSYITRINKLKNIINVQIN